MPKFNVKFLVEVEVEADDYAAAHVAADAVRDDALSGIQDDADADASEVTVVLVDEADPIIVAPAAEAVVQVEAPAAAPALTGKGYHVTLSIDLIVRADYAEEADTIADRLETDVGDMLSDDTSVHQVEGSGYTVGDPVAIEAEDTDDN